MSENLVIKRSEENKEYGKQLVDAGNAWRWAMVFNELCDDGIIRPVAILPGQVTSIKSMESTIPGSKYGYNAEFIGATAIVHEGCEILLYEPIRLVISALGSVLLASENWTAHVFYASAMFEQKGINFRHEFDRTQNDTDSR